VNGQPLAEVDGLEIGPDAPVGWSRDAAGIVRLMIRLAPQDGT
jgi:hypothetical protein